VGILQVNLKVLLFFHWDFVTPEPRFVGVKIYALLKQGFRDYTVFILNKLCSIFWQIMRTKPRIMRELCELRNISSRKILIASI